MRNVVLRILCRPLSLAVTLVFAFAAPPVRGQDSFEQEPILYLTAEPEDVVSRLQAQIAGGDAQLAYRQDRGYLDDLLGKLQVPRSSQTLVFSKTSFQPSKISPRTPRALYFNDDVYVGWVQNSDTLELSVANPKLGSTFYTLEKSAGGPRFTRQTHNCLQCHASAHTDGIPGHIVRSVYPGEDGTPVYRAGTFRTDQTSPFEQRWGGWYVTGTHGTQRHMGNVLVQDPEATELLDVEAGANLRDLSSKFDTAPYASGHSDIVALLVLEHQSQLHNLITAANFETRRALHHQAVMNRLFKEPEDYQSDTTKSRIRNACRRLVAYMLFTDEAPLNSEIVGGSDFTREFAARGPFDERGRSLRQFDLKRRLFKYPCSYLIYTESFAGLPPAALDQVYRQLYDVLTGTDEDERFAHLASADRQAILEILRATKSDLPAYWRQQD
jgi:hypothetical protein